MSREKGSFNVKEGRRGFRGRRSNILNKDDLALP